VLIARGRTQRLWPQGSGCAGSHDQAADAPSRPTAAARRGLGGAQERGPEAGWKSLSGASHPLLQDTLLAPDSRVAMLGDDKMVRQLASGTRR